MIDRKLWENVQTTVQRITGSHQGKRTAVQRVNPLVGLLRFKDGSTFGGTGAWGSGKIRLNYYYNKQHKIRLKAEVLEEIAVTTVSKMIEETPELRDAIRRRGAQKSSALQLLSGEIEKRKLALIAIQQQQEAANRRLDFLLGDGSLVDPDKLRQDYASERAKLNSEREGIEHTIDRLSGQRRDLEQGSFDWKTLGGNARRVLEVIAEHDPIALKNAYQGLFEAIVVGEINANGVRPLDFIVRDGRSWNSKNETAPAAFVTAEAISSDTKILG